MRILQDAAPDRVAVFDLENADGVPIYVHAKICVVDDVWLTCGSDNFNRRSWTNDSELTCAVIDPTRDEREPRQLDAHGDGARRLPRDLRLAGLGASTSAATRTTRSSSTRPARSRSGAGRRTPSTRGTPAGAAVRDRPGRCGGTGPTRWAA